MTDHKSREALRVRFAKIIIEMQLLAGLLDRFTYEEAAPVAFAAADRILAILPVAPVVGERETAEWFDLRKLAKQCPAIHESGGWCCLRPAGHDGPHANTRTVTYVDGEPGESMRVCSDCGTRLPPPSEP